MTKLFIIFFIFITISLGVVSQENKSFFKDRERGWFWYEKNLSLNPKNNKKNNNSYQNSKKLSPKEILKMQREVWENALSAAVVTPSRANILKYLKETKKISDQAKLFADNFKESLWSNPQYDNTIDHPYQAKAILAKNRKKNKEIKSELFKISNKYGLVFFFSSSCPVCHQFAPILKNFQNKFDFSVIAVSLNGEGIEGYPNFKNNFSLAGKLNLTKIPALFIINTRNGKITPVSYGFTDLNTLKYKTIVASKRVRDE